MIPFQSLEQLKTCFVEAGATRLFAKALASNDNSKQQVYLGGAWDAVRVLPIDEVSASGVGGKKHFAASLRLFWIDRTSAPRPAPHAKIILYPQYPEVRFSGFLRGVTDAPVAEMTSRERGRILFFGVTPNGRVLAYVATAGSRVARDAAEATARTGGSRPLAELDLGLRETPASQRRQLLAALRRIFKQGWINSKQLAAGGLIQPCEAQNCGGFTLEAELDIPKNSRAEADYAGWEVKQFAATASGNTGSGRITLMTPEPNGGIYATKGADAFIRQFGYGDRRGRRNRVNFGGNFRVGRRVRRTGLTLTLDGFDTAAGRIVDADGRVVLLTDDDEVAASWSFAGLMTHWSRKHQYAAYVPSQRRLKPRRQYRFGPAVHLGEGTDFVLFLSALADGSVVYDPGMKLVLKAGRVAVKRRSQFRVISSRLPLLYSKFSSLSLLTS